MGGSSTPVLRFDIWNIYISLNKDKHENSFNRLYIAKNQEFELITSCYFKKHYLSKTHMEQYSDFLNCPYLDHISDFFKKISQKIQ